MNTEETDTEYAIRPFPHLNVDDIDSSFPKESYRDGQKRCIEFAVNAFNSGKRIVILECPTGSGKSAIGMTIANMVSDSYYLTITKILQDQLTKDFDDIIDLKGRNAYPCTLYQRYGAELVRKTVLKQSELDEKLRKRPDCASGFCRTKSNKTAGEKTRKHACDKCFLATQPVLIGKSKVPKGDQRKLPEGLLYSTCPYYEQVFKAIQAPKVVMNFSGFLYQTSLTKRFEKPRDLLIIDEAHNIEPQILDFISLSINDSMLQKHGIFIPKLDTALNYAEWFNEIKLDDIIKELIDIADVNDNQKEADDLERLLKKYEMFMWHLSKAGAEWVVEYNLKEEKGKSWRSLTLKPVYATDFAESLLLKFGKKILLMSATILDVDVMCRSLGLNRDEVAAFRMKNRFPAENRPIYIRPAARMTGGKDKMGEWLPKLVKSVESIIEKHKGQRGIIHTHNFAIMEAIMNKCKPSVAKRLLTQREFSDKRDMLVAHAKVADSVIVAPAMHEGIDLIGDLSRFQVICKIPYPNFYDNEQLARRVEVDPNYYTWLTALKLIQSYGRSIRSETDKADTYIIDAAIDKFLEQAKRMLPSWFTEAIIYDEDRS